MLALKTLLIKGLQKMAKIKNFSDFNGQCVELAYVTSIPNQEFAARFPGVKGLRYDGYSMWTYVAYWRPPPSSQTSTAA